MEDGRWKMGDGRWEMEDGRWKREEGKWEMGDGRWKMEGNTNISGYKRLLFDSGQKLFVGLPKNKLYERKNNSTIRKNIYFWS